MINVELKVILIKITVFLPSGLGFLIIKEMFGSPPNAVLQGFHADMLSSQHIHCEVLTRVLQISLNSSMAAENLYQGSFSFLASSIQMQGSKLWNSLNQLNDMYCSNCGLGQIDGQYSAPIVPSSLSESEVVFLKLKS
jgi:hypothetical protein